MFIANQYKQYHFLKRNTTGIKKICIVTTRHISYNPRVLKEADTFFNNGYEVSVVTINNHSGQYKFDEELMKTRSWKFKTVNFRKEIKTEKFYWFYISLLQELYLLLSNFSLKFGIAERAALKGFGALARLAKKEKADVYLLHHAESLGVGFKAASKNAKIGFDAEDFHSGMNESGNLTKEDKIISFLEKKYLPRCTYFTVASKGIGEAYVNKYGIKGAGVILNVFPKEEVASAKIHEPIRFYWYSQVIGPNRNLETLLVAAAQIKDPFEIHLRGSFHNPEYEKLIKDLLYALHLTANVFFHEPILSEDIIKDAARFDVGLALESDISINRNICVTNKIFSYLMSGLAIIGTDTYGQQDIFSHFDEAVRICKKNDVNDLAKAMIFYIHNHDKLLLAKQAARKAALERFNWEIESGKLISNFKKSLHVEVTTQRAAINEQ